MRPTEISRFC
uniref:Uncharacterized protein n=1 Tax=Anguilla anguilla TaxID=7936 RepID=A0A0E9P6Y6_ANGAN